MKEGEIERVIDLLKEANDAKKCINIMKDILTLLINGC